MISMDRVVQNEEYEVTRRNELFLLAVDTPGVLVFSIVGCRYWFQLEQY